VASVGTELDQRPDVSNVDGDHERFAHFIAKRDEMPGYLEGRTVTALCGKRWVPTRDPSRYPICPTCRELAAR